MIPLHTILAYGDPIATRRGPTSDSAHIQTILDTKNSSDTERLWWPYLAKVKIDLKRPF